MKQEILKKGERKGGKFTNPPEHIYCSTGSDRRSFIRKALFGTLGINVMLKSSFSDRKKILAIESFIPEIPVIDTHIHCFAGPNNILFPYHAKASYKPDTIATPEQLLICMNKAGVDFGILVSPEPYQDDHRYLEHCLEKGKGRLKGTILVFCDRPGSMDQLPRLAKRGDIIATRIHAYLPDRLPPFGKPELHKLWKMAADNGLAIQLNVLPRYAEGFDPLIREFHDVPVIIDHLGQPLQAKLSQEYLIIRRWGDLPNTVIKFSNLGTIQEDPNPEIKLYVDQMIAAYGIDRMIWGGDFSNNPTTESYCATINYARSFLRKFSIKDQEKVFGGNASRLFWKVKRL